VARRAGGGGPEARQRRYGGHPRLRARRIAGEGLAWRTALVLGSRRAISGELAARVGLVSGLGKRLVHDGHWPGARLA
jgi:hypothetical protein